MKKVISLLLALLMYLFLCACSDSQPVCNNEPVKEETVVQTPSVVYDKEDLDEMLAYIETEAITMVDAAKNDAETLMSGLGETYETYDKNKDRLSAYYAATMSKSEAFFAFLQTVCVDYYKYLASQGLDNYDIWNDAMDDLYDVWDDAMDDYYDAWDGAYDDIYDCCDDLIEDGSEELAYQEYSDVWSAMYNAHSDAWSMMYNAHSNAWSTSYNNHSAVWSGFYSDNADVDAILKAAAEETSTDGTTIPEDTIELEESTAPEDTTEPEETLAPEDAAPELVDGMRSNFKEAMDAYEAFYDEYCKFMTEYSENLSDLVLLAKYGELLIKAEKMDKAFDEWKEDEMNDAELKYYLEVSDRIMQKLIDVAN